MDEFRKLGLSEPILKALQDEKFVVPTEVQEKAIPYCLQGKDVIAESATGTGKTLAFGSAIIQHCERGKGIQALVLTPTRELAEQILKNLITFSKYKRLSITAVYGGVSIGPQIHHLKTADVVVATPGRVLDHMERGTINFSKAKILVLDEADRMLDMGFIDDVLRIVKACPKERQTLLFSATIFGKIKEIAQRYMNSPVKVAAANRVDPSKLAQCYYDILDNQKFSLLVHLLKSEHSGLVMVFCNTQRSTEFVVKNLRQNGIDAIAIHGGYSQNKRTQTMEEFHAKEAHVLVCTDIASRGIDVKDVSHVYNYELPNDEKQYIHRIGRTARAGVHGKVVNLLGQKDHDNFRRVLSLLGIRIQKEPNPEFERVHVKMSHDRENEGRFSQQRRFHGQRRHGNQQRHSGFRRR
ncbi:DEAD/DEAH box helicase [Candidatus Woesearchaeota archaeon]|nr:DEAD/DEAH box helicase [Candidatus Woesearchaeota archaeon]